MRVARHSLMLICNGLSVTFIQKYNSLEVTPFANRKEKTANVRISVDRRAKKSMVTLLFAS
jgi:hypothetical protein